MISPRNGLIRKLTRANRFKHQQKYFYWLSFMIRIFLSKISLISVPNFCKRQLISWFRSVFKKCFKSWWFESKSRYDMTPSCQHVLFHLSAFQSMWEHLILEVREGVQATLHSKSMLMWDRLWSIQKYVPTENFALDLHICLYF